MLIIIYKRRGFDHLELFEHANFPKNDPIVVDAEKSLIGVISSTEVRRRVCENHCLPFYRISGLVTSKVISYISEHKLYLAPSEIIDEYLVARSPILMRCKSQPNGITLTASPLALSINSAQSDAGTS